MGMWGVEEDDTKGKARLPSTYTHTHIPQVGMIDVEAST